MPASLTPAPGPPADGATAEHRHLKAAVAAATPYEDKPEPLPGAGGYDRPIPPPDVTPIGTIHQPGKVKVEGRVRVVEIRSVEQNSVLASTLPPTPPATSLPCSTAGPGSPARCADPGSGSAARSALSTAPQSWSTRPTNLSSLPRPANPPKMASPPESARSPGARRSLPAQEQDCLARGRRSRCQMRAVDTVVPAQRPCPLAASRRFPSRRWPTTCEMRGLEIRHATDGLPLCCLPTHSGPTSWSRTAASAVPPQRPRPGLW